MNLSLFLFPLGWQHDLLGGLIIGLGTSLLFVLRRPFFQQARFVESRDWRLVYAAGLILGALVQGLRAK